MDWCETQSPGSLCWACSCLGSQPTMESCSSYCCLFSGFWNKLMVSLLWCLPKTWSTFQLVCQEHPHPRLQGASSGTAAKTSASSIFLGALRAACFMWSCLFPSWGMECEGRAEHNTNKEWFSTFHCVLLLQKTETHWMKRMCSILRFFFLLILPFLSALDCLCFFALILQNCHRITES